MGMTMTQKILAAHCRLKRRSRRASSSMPSWISSSATTSPPPLPSMSLKRPGSPRCSIRPASAIVLDHFVPNKDIKSRPAVQAVPGVRQQVRHPQLLRCRQHGHRARAAARERASSPPATASSAPTATPAPTVRWAPSPPAWAPPIWPPAWPSGMAWFKVPSAIKVAADRQALQPYVGGKDVILHSDRRDRRGRAPCTSPWSSCGEGVEEPDAWRTGSAICNMAIEAGAKNGIFPVDDMTCEAYLKGRGQPPLGQRTRPTPTLSMSATVVIDLDSSGAHRRPIPICPRTPTPPREGKDIAIDQVVIGSCTNGRIEDMEAADSILKGRKDRQGRARHHHPRHPGSLPGVHRPRIHHAFIDAGCIVSTPTCGPCLGGYMGILAAGRALRLHHQPQLRGPHGPCGQRSLSGQPRHRRGQRR